MIISEIYCSRQGEGQLTGTPSVFVRTSGCNLRCSYCDTPFASWNPAGDQLTLDQILQCVGESANDHLPIATHVVLTGGEPMLSREIVPLCQRLKENGFHLTIETAGTLFRSLTCDLMSISPKFANSTPTKERAGEWQAKHEAARFQPAIVQQLIRQYDYQLKFVVDQPSDLEEIRDYLSIVVPDSPTRVMLMPQGIDFETLTEKAKWLKLICDAEGFTFCPRRHIEWYGNRRGT